MAPHNQYESLTKGEMYTSNGGEVLLVDELDMFYTFLLYFQFPGQGVATMCITACRQDWQVLSFSQCPSDSDTIHPVRDLFPQFSWYNYLCTI